MVFSIIKGLLFIFLSSLILFLIYHVITVSYALYPHANLKSYYLTPLQTRPFKSLENDYEKPNLYGLDFPKRNRSLLPFDSYENKIITNLVPTFLENNHYLKFEELSQTPTRIMEIFSAEYQSSKDYRKIYKGLKSKYNDKKKSIEEFKKILGEDSNLISAERTNFWSEVVQELPYTRKLNDFKPTWYNHTLTSNLRLYYQPTISYVLGEKPFEYSINSISLDQEEMLPRLKKYTLKVNTHDLEWEYIKERYFYVCGKDIRCQPSSFPRLVVVFTTKNAQWTKIIVNGNEVNHFPVEMETRDKMVFMWPEPQTDVITFVVKGESPNGDLYYNSSTSVGLSFGVEFPELGVIFPVSGSKWIDRFEIEWSFFERVEKVLKPTAENLIALSIIFSALLLWSYIGYLLFSKRTFKLKRLLVSRFKPR